MNSSIDIIKIGGNKDLDDKCIKSVCEFVNNNVFIQELNARDTQISDSGIMELSSMLCQNLRGDSKFRKINFHGNKKITNKIIPLLIQLIEATRIEHIGVEYTSINKKNVLLLPLINNELRNGSTSLDLSSR